MLKYVWLGKAEKDGYPVSFVRERRMILRGTGRFEGYLMLVMRKRWIGTKEGIESKSVDFNPFVPYISESRKGHV
jgi:hypothetical protein